LRLEGTDSTIWLNVWDTAGQERYRPITALHYRDAAAAVLCFDITFRDSFDKVLSWAEELKNYCDNEEMILVLVGNKADDLQNIEVSAEEG